MEEAIVSPDPGTLYMDCLTNENINQEIIYIFPWIMVAVGLCDFDIFCITFCLKPDDTVYVYECQTLYILGL